MPGIVDLVQQHESPGERQTKIVDVLVDAFSELMAADPDAFRNKFRKMAASPFAFYRGSAPLFYTDMEGEEDRWANDRTSRVWVQGDLHAENFGTYMAGDGVFVFDVNDFDEAYLGHFTWDIKRMAASVALLGWMKAISDADIAWLIETYVRAYLQQVRYFVDSDRDHAYSLRLDTSDGDVRKMLLETRLNTRVDLLDETTLIDESFDRRFRRGPGVRELDDAERASGHLPEFVPKRVGVRGHELGERIYQHVDDLRLTLTGGLVLLHWVHNSGHRAPFIVGGHWFLASGLSPALSGLTSMQSQSSSYPNARRNCPGVTARV